MTPPRRTPWTLAAAWLAGGAAALAAGAGCGGGDGSPCGPTSGVVARVIDGDTIELESGERIRYLLVDTPETTGGNDDCYGEEAKTFNTSMVLGKRVSIAYDEAECEDHFDRLLAFVSVDGREVNGELVQRGYACTLYIPPAGADRRDEFEDYELRARTEGRGMWSACEVVACDD